MGVIDTESKHSAIDLRRMLLKILEDYNLPVCKTLAGITDNASNMVKLMVDLDKVNISTTLLNIFQTTREFKAVNSYFFKTTSLDSDYDNQ